MTIPCWTVRPGAIDVLSRLGQSTFLWGTIRSINGNPYRPCLASEGGAVIWAERAVDLAPGNEEYQDFSNRLTGPRTDSGQNSLRCAAASMWNITHE